jgi:serine/threonine protein kinase
LADFSGKWLRFSAFSGIQDKGSSFGAGPIVTDEGIARMPEDTRPPQPLRDAEPKQAAATAPPSGAASDPACPTLNGAGEESAHAGGGAPAPDSFVGTCVGDFELLAELGRGGMGIVYKAKQKSLDRTVALKMLQADPSRSETVLARFLAEARAAAALAHPNIVTIFQVGQCPAGHYFAMEYIDGPTLEEVLQKGPVPVPWAVTLLAHVAAAVHYAHTKGVIHRDLKPANIMIDRGRRPVVMDFGIAKMAGKASALTQEGLIIGTPAFMSPEQARSGAVPVGPRSDVYALGAILYTLLAGRFPFDEGSSLDTLLKVVSPQPPPSVRSIRSEVPGALERLCMKCLAKDPADRPASARALAEGLRRVKAHLPVAKEGLSSARRQMRSVVLVNRTTGKAVRLFNPCTLVGRSSDCDIVIKAADVSKRHCQILLEGDQVILEDLDSSNGTCVNGEAVERCVLHGGDEVEIAGHVFEVRLPAPKA